MFTNAIDWLFRNRETGRITIAQFPNLALWVFLASYLARQSLRDGTDLHELASWINVAALVWWAADEILRGVNPWRRFLGAGVMVFALVALSDLVS